MHMYPLDFEEFLYANGFNRTAIDTLRDKFLAGESLDEKVHEQILGVFKK